MCKLAFALWETHGVTLEEGDVVEFHHGYCNHNLVDVVVTDSKTGEVAVFECFDTTLGIFPY